MSNKTAFRVATNGYFHVYNRGVKKAAIFDQPRNYDFFLKKVSAALQTNGVKVVCFCLMPNHFHFLLEQMKPEGISNFMQQTCNGYAKALNKQRMQTGHVFESKYKMKLVESNEYLLWLSRYIHRNPKEAGIVQSIADWKYSSYEDFVNSQKYAFVKSETVLSQFQSPNDYREFVEGEDREEPKDFRKCLFDE